MGFFSKLIKGIGNVFGVGESSTQFARKAGNADIASQMQGLDYLKGAIDPRLQSEQTARNQLLDYYAGNSQTLTDNIQSSPIYNYLQDLGMQGVAASASTTGNLRGGNAKRAFYQENQSILNSLINQKLSGLQGLARPVNVAPVAQIYSNIGDSQASKYQAIGQAKQDKYKNIFKIGSKIASNI